MHPRMTNIQCLACEAHEHIFASAGAHVYRNYTLEDLERDRRTAQQLGL